MITQETMDKIVLYMYKRIQKNKKARVYALKKWVVYEYQLQDKWEQWDSLWRYVENKLLELGVQKSSGMYLYTEDSVSKMEYPEPGVSIEAIQMGGGKISMEKVVSLIIKKVKGL